MVDNSIETQADAEGSRGFPLLEKIGGWIFAVPAPLFTVAIFTIMLLKSGVWFMPGLGLPLKIAENPFINPLTDPDAHYFFWSWLPPFLAWLLGIHGQAGFLLLHLVFSLAFIALFAFLAFRHLPDRQARTAIILFAALPVSATSFYWIGVDSFTLFLMLLTLALLRRPLLAFVAAVALGMTHFEQGFFGIGAVAFVALVSLRYGSMSRNFSFLRAATALAGVIGGKLILIGIVHFNAIEVNSGRSYWLLEHFPMLFSQFFFGVQQALWSVLGLGWLAAVKMLGYGRRSVPVFVALALLLCLLPIVGDQTRVLCIVTFPIIYLAWLSDSAFLSGIRPGEAAFVLLLWLILPWFWVWGGVPQPPMLSFDIAMVLHHAFGVFDVPADFSMWPFLQR